MQNLILLWLLKHTEHYGPPDTVYIITAQITQNDKYGFTNIDITLAKKTVNEKIMKTN